MHFINAKSILSPFNGMNVYRGCTHGCIYCDSRSLCYHTPVPFEDIEVKQNAPTLLHERLLKKRQKCMIGTGGMCDPYMHCEKDLGITRQCLELIARYGFGAAIQTKSDLILRDLDLLQEINTKAKCVVQMTLTTYDDALCSILEPTVCPTSRRLYALREVALRGIPIVVWLSPFLPFINDDYENFDALLRECIALKVKGIICFGIGVTMREGNREYFYAKLDEHFPGLKQKYERTYGTRYELWSPTSARLMAHFHALCKENAILHTPDECFAYLRDFPQPSESIQGEFAF